MKLFAFNLLPDKDKKLVEREETRDRSSIYSAILPLIAAFIWMGLTVFNGTVVTEVKQKWELALKNKQGRINGEFADVRAQNGELVLKTNALATVIERDVKPETLFELTEKIFAGNDRGIVLVGYGRDDDGSFDVNLRTTDYTRLAEVTRRFSVYGGSDKTMIKSASIDPKTGEITATVNFFIDIPFIEAEIDAE